GTGGIETIIRVRRRGCRLSLEESQAAFRTWRELFAKQTLLPQCGPQSGRTGSVAECSLRIYDSVLQQLLKLAVEVLHTVIRAGFHRLEKRVSVPLAVFNARTRVHVCLENLQHSDSCAAVCTRNQSLRNDVTERFREPGSYRLLLSGTKGGHKPAHCLSHIQRVHAREHKVASFRRVQNGLHGLAIADFADQNHFRRLPQRRAKSQSNAWSIAMQLTLMNGRAFVVVKELNGVFDGDDVVIMALVYVVQNGCQR